MILIPRLLNRYSKDRPSWQERYERRLALLKFAGMSFWKPEDFALVGPLPPELQFTSVGVFPYGTVAAVDGGSSYTLTLNTLSASDSDTVAATAGIRFQRNSDVEEGSAGIWTPQNSGTEWIDDPSTTVGDDYEAKHDHTSGTSPTYTGGTWADNVWNQIDEQLQAQLTRFVVGTSQSVGTAYVREIAVPANQVSASCTITATVISDGCPLCCFTPDTLITMANGELTPICEIEVGDSIRTRNGVEQVTEVITRVERPMFMVEFNSGHSLHMSEDHPIYVFHGKGYSSINPTVPYKDLGVPNVLEIGDKVLSLCEKCPTGEKSITVTSIEPAEYLHTVYTLGNSEFFADGILVY